jgi:hypothetical protein
VTTPFYAPRGAIPYICLPFNFNPDLYKLIDAITIFAQRLKLNRIQVTDYGGTYVTVSGKKLTNSNLIRLDFLS